MIFLEIITKCIIIFNSSTHFSSTAASPRTDTILLGGILVLSIPTSKIYISYCRPLQMMVATVNYLSGKMTRTNIHDSQKLKYVISKKVLFYKKIIMSNTITEV